MNILFHLIKSLLYRNHADVNRCFDEVRNKFQNLIINSICYNSENAFRLSFQLLITLSQPEIHETIKEGFHELSVEDEYFLNAASHFRIELVQH